MFALLFAPLVVAVCWFCKPFAAKRPPFATLLDVPTEKSAFQLLLTLPYPTDGDEELEVVITRLYERFPPTEESLRRLATFQQKLCGTHTPDEYATSLLLLCAMNVVNRLKHLPPRPLRARSVSPGSRSKQLTENVA